VLLVENGTCRLEDGTLAGVTLPQLEGVKRLAQWTNEPGAAIWSATVAPRIAIQANHSTADALGGRSIQDLLRWHLDHTTLGWRNAAQSL